MFRQGLKLMLKADTRFEVAGEVGDGEQALAFIERERPALAILDVGLPKMSGIEVVRGVVARDIGTKCVMLTMHEEPEIVLGALEAGAVGYILKGHTFDDLKVALQTVMEGGTFVSPRIAAIQDAEARRGERSEALTSREREVLALIARGMANKEIADQLTISIRTVEAHRSAIMRKLRIKTHAGLIHYATQKHILPS